MLRSAAIRAHPGLAIGTVMLALGVFARGAQGRQAEGPEASPPPPAAQRVSVIIDPYRSVCGTVVTEDDFTLVLRADGRDVEVTKTRAMHIVRLLDLPAPQQGVISFRDGRNLRATIVTDDCEGVTYEIAGVRNLLARELVLTVRLLPSIEERLASMKSSLVPEDVDRRIQICRWLLDERRPDLAAAELQELLEAHPDHATARELLTTAQHAVARAAGDAGSTAPHAPPTPAAPSNPYLGRLLTPEEVNLIRVFEVDLADPPRLRVEPSTVHELLAQYSSSKLVPTSPSDRARLAEADPAEALRLMFALKAREFYPRVEVLSEPASLRLFARNVHNRWLIPNCATSRCHGGTDAGDLFLHNGSLESAAVRTTNLLILLRKEFDGKGLVDFGSPRDSLLVQYALPRHLAHTPHPAVRGWTPAFARDPNRMATETEVWIRSMYQPRPDYMVDYDPPARPTIPSDDPSQSGER